LIALASEVDVAMYINRVDPHVTTPPAQKRGKNLSDSIETFVIEDPVEISNAVGDDEQQKRKQQQQSQHKHEQEEKQRQDADASAPKSIDVRV